MILIFGGFYQGKLDFAKETFKLSEEDIFFCENDSLVVDENKKCIYNIEHLVKSYIKSEKEEKELNKYIENISMTNKVIIATDMSQGIVPLDKQDRMARDWTGRLLTKLANQSDEVYRVFAGLGQKLK